VTAADEDPRVPWDVIDRVMLFAWLEGSVRDHLSLYLSLAGVCSHLRGRVRAIAQQYMFYRGPQDRSLYSRLLIPPGQPIAEFHVQFPSYSVKRNEWLTAELSRLQPGFHHSEFATEQNITFVTSTIYVYPPYWVTSGRHASHETRSLDIMQNLLSAFTPLRPCRVVLVNISPQILCDESPERLDDSSICRLTLDVAQGDVYGWTRWSSSKFSLREMAPHLTHLSIISSSTPLKPLLPLPARIEELVLDIPIGIPGAPKGNLHSWGLMSALKQQLQLSDRAKAQFRLVLLTGLEDPVGWLEVSLLAREMGIRLERRIVH
jgi:hypothetical protein